MTDRVFGPYDVDVTHYEVLGVSARAPAEEIRRAYLMLAARASPRLPGRHRRRIGGSRSADAEINLAWQVLGDEQGRAAYDRSLGLRDDVGPVSTGPIIKQPSTEFRPYFAEDDDDDDDWRYEPDEVDPTTVPPKALLIAPPALLAIGVVLLAISLPLGSRQLTVFGVMSLGFAVLLFIATPVVAMFRSQSAEERVRRQR